MNQPSDRNPGRLAALFGTPRRRWMAMLAIAFVCLGTVMCFEWQPIKFRYCVSMLRRTGEIWTHANPQCESMDIGDGADLEYRSHLIGMYQDHPRRIGLWLLKRLADSHEHIKVRETAIEAFCGFRYCWDLTKVTRLLDESGLAAELSAACSRIHQNAEEPPRLREAAGFALDQIVRSRREAPTSRCPPASPRLPLRFPPSITA